MRITAEPITKQQEIDLSTLIARGRMFNESSAISTRPRRYNNNNNNNNNNNKSSATAVSKLLVDRLGKYESMNVTCMFV